MVGCLKWKRCLNQPVQIGVEGRRLLKGGIVNDEKTCPKHIFKKQVFESIMKFDLHFYG